MVRPVNLRRIGICILVSAFTASASAQPQPQRASSFPFDRNELSQQVNNLLVSKGLRGSFQRDNCQEATREDISVSFCEYSFYELKYRLWWQPSSDRVALITARTSYSSRHSLGDAAVLGLSAVIAAVEGSDDDEAILNIVDRLRSASRSLSGSSFVETSHARYKLSLGRDGYAFSATNRAD